MSTPPDPSPGPLRSDARRHRDAVLAAAVHVLSARPDASVREIAEASGVGRTTVYRHFPGREDLVRALYVRVLDEAFEIADRAVTAGREAWAAGGGDALEVLVGLAVAFSELGERYRFLAAHREHEQELTALAAERGDEPIASFLEEARDRGELRAGLTVRWMLDVLNGLTMVAAQHVQDPSRSAAEIRPMLESTVRGAFAPA